jgi:hypothetical protein
MDSHSWVLWVGIVAIGLHVMEEYAQGWLAWANQQVGPRFGIRFTETDFFFTAFLLIFYALAGAAIGWWAPAVSLAIPALFVVNAIFLHMLPSLRADRLTPGTLTAVVIYLPVAAWMFWAAAEDDVLSIGTVVLAFVLGTALMYYPLAVAVLAKRTGWQEDAGSAAERSTGEDAPGAPDPTPPETSGEAERRDPTPDEEPVIEVEERVVETQTIVLDPDPEDETTVLDREDQDPPRQV